MTSDIKKTVKISGLSLFFVFIIFYSFFISKDLILGVKIRNVNMKDGATIPEKVIKITGNAKNAIKLTLNGREISIDQDGNFDETISLLLGYNIVTIKARDKFGSVDEKNYKLMHI